MTRTQPHKLLLTLLLALPAITHTRVIVHDLDTHSPVSTFGPNNFTVSGNLVEFEFSSSCTPHIVPPTTNPPTASPSWVALISLRQAVAHNCHKHSQIFRKILTLTAEQSPSTTLSAVIFTRQFEGEPESQSHRVTLVPGVLWLSEEDNDANKIFVPSVTVRRVHLDSLRAYAGNRSAVVVTGNDKSEWTTFYESYLYLLIRCGYLAIFSILAFAAVQGMWSDFKRHGRRWRSLSHSIPEFTQFWVALTLIGRIMPQTPDPLDSYMSPVIVAILTDSSFFCGIFAILSFFVVWLIMLTTFEGSLNNLDNKTARVFVRFWFLASVHFSIFVCLIGLRAAFPQAVPNRYFDNTLNATAGIEICLISVGVWRFSRQLNAFVRRASMSSVNSISSTVSPFSQMVRVRNRMGILAIILFIAEIGLFAFGARFTIAWSMILAGIVHGFTIAFTAVLLRHFAVARQNIRVFRSSDAKTAEAELAARESQF